MPRKGQIDPEKKGTADCPQCGKSFTYYHSAPTPTFCSSACYLANNASKKTEKVCPTCGETFSFYKSWPRVYCSRKCSGKANVGNIKRHVVSSYTTTCEQCGTTYETSPKATRGRFCSRACWGAWMSIHRRGENSRVHGIKHPWKARVEQIELTCPSCGKTFVEAQGTAAKRVCCSRACLAIYVRETGRQSGANNFNWRGGYDPYYGPSWRPAMRAARARDRVCQRCGKSPADTGKALDVHHKRPFREFGVERHAEANALDNLISLCAICHLIVEPRRK